MLGTCRPAERLLALPGPLSSQIKNVINIFPKSILVYVGKKTVQNSKHNLWTDHKHRCAVKKSERKSLHADFVVNKEK